MYVTLINQDGETIVHFIKFIAMEIVDGKLCISFSSADYKEFYLGDIKTMVVTEN